jgi:BNR repeat protein/type IX secretion system substrate protein
MRIKWVTIIAGLSCLFLDYGTSQAQWERDVRLTNDTAVSYTSFGNAWCVSAVGGFVHVVWFTRGSYPIISGWEVYYKRSSDGGTTWEPAIQLTNHAYYGIPSIAASGTFIHVIWNDNRDGNREIYYKRSTDNGLSWSADTRLTSSHTTYPSLSVSGSFVHLLCRATTTSQIIYKRSTDQGITWSADTLLANSNGPTVCISSSGQLVHVTWFDNRDGNDEIYYKRSANAGLTWGADIRLTNDTAASWDSRVAASGSFVHVFWRDFRTGSSEMYYKRSTDGGLNWDADTRLTYSPSSQTNPAASGSNVHVVWEDYSGNPQIYYKRSTDAGITWDADTRLTNTFASSLEPSVALSGPVVHVVWHDNRDGNYEIYYKRNQTGNPIGIMPIGSEIPKEFALKQNYPNPFNPLTTIELDIAKSGKVLLNIFDVLGKPVAQIINENLMPGTYKVKWDASRFSSGIYYYTLETGGYRNTKKMVLVK